VALHAADSVLGDMQLVTATRARALPGRLDVEPTTSRALRCVFMRTGPEDQDHERKRS
jgi:hypothetical protein